MPELPKIVRDRLSASKAAAGHPDADLLTAFAELALPASERAFVMEHLGRCGECREVVSLALPASEAVEMAGAPARRGWLRGPVLRWPVLGWSAAVAAIVAVVSLGVLRHEQPTRTVAVNMKPSSRNEVGRDDGNQAHNSAPSAHLAASGELRQDAPATLSATTPMAGALTPEKTEVSRKSAPDSESHAAQAVTGNVSVRNKRESDSERLTKFAMAQPPHDLDLGSTPKAFPESAAKQLPPDRNFRSPAPAPASPVPSRGMDEAKPADTGLTAQNRPQDQLADYQSEGAAQAGAFAKVDKAKPPVAGEDVAAAPLPSSRAVASSSLAEPVVNRGAPATRWTVNATGSLLRSFDGGQTWQEVNVDRASSGGRNSVSTSELSLKASARAAKAKAPANGAAGDESALAQKDKTPVFRSVVAIGEHIWAGGSGGALYHSEDGGDHWTRLVPSSGGMPLTGDITALEFSDPQHGKMATSTFEVWTTNDGGRTWQKQ